MRERRTAVAVCCLSIPKEGGRGGGRRRLFVRKDAPSGLCRRGRSRCDLRSNKDDAYDGLEEGFGVKPRVLRGGVRL